MKARSNTIATLAGLTVVAVLVTNSMASAANSTFYYAYDKRIVLTPMQDKVIITHTPGFDRDQIGKALPGLTFETARADAYLVRGDASAIAALRQRLEKDPSIRTIQPVYRTQDGAEVGVADDFCVAFLPGVTQEQKEALQGQWKVRPDEVADQCTESKFFDVLKVGRGGDAVAVANAYQESGLVKYAHPNFVIRAEHCYMPTDPYFGKQFNLHNIGQILNDNHTGTPDADVDAPEAWDITKGDPQIVVAVIDEGVNWTHADLDANIWVNPDEIPNNGVDDDNNCKIDDVRGWDFVSGDNDPSPTGDLNHGNACAGIVAAEQDNPEGITGIAPHCKIMPLRISFAPFGSTVLDFAQAIEYAWGEGADIISSSWTLSAGDPTVYPVIVDAIENATTQGRGGLGTVMCFATGNTASHVSGNDGVVCFPANVEIPGVLTVGASDRYDHQSNYSPTSASIDITAPSHRAYYDQIAGESREVWSLDIPLQFGWNPGKEAPHQGEVLPNSGPFYLSYTGRMGGTSAATPLVAGIAALVLSVDPGLTQLQVFDRLTQTADKVGCYTYTNGKSNELGYGRVNAFRAVTGNTDATGPATISNLVAELEHTTGVATWTAPGDDGTTGTAAAFDLRISTAPITPANFCGATQVATVAPGPPGTLHCADLGTLVSCVTYYIAIKTTDEGYNWSPMSNLASGTTTCTGSLEVTCDTYVAAPPPDVASDAGGSSGRESSDVAKFALYGTVSNPARIGARLDVSFSLPDSRAASLALFDVAGRRVVARDVGSLGRGRHVVGLSSIERLAAGVYVLRLTRDGTSLQARVVLMP